MLRYHLLLALAFALAASMPPHSCNAEDLPVDRAMSAPSDQKKQPQESPASVDQSDEDSEWDELVQSMGGKNLLDMPTEGEHADLTAANVDAVVVKVIGVEDSFVPESEASPEHLDVRLECELLARMKRVIKDEAKLVIEGTRLSGASDVTGFPRLAPGDIVVMAVTVDEDTPGEAKYAGRAVLPVGLFTPVVIKARDVADVKEAFKRLTMACDLLFREEYWYLGGMGGNCRDETNDYLWSLALRVRALFHEDLWEGVDEKTSYKRVVWLEYLNDNVVDARFRENAEQMVAHMNGYLKKRAEYEEAQKGISVLVPATEDNPDAPSGGPNSVGGLCLTVSTDKRVYEQTDNITITAKFENHGEHSCGLSYGGTRYKLTWNGVVIWNGAADRKWGYYVRVAFDVFLGRGQSRTILWSAPDIPLAGEMRLPGKYRLQYSWVRDSERPTYWDLERSLISNVVEFEILPPAENRNAGSQRTGDVELVSSSGTSGGQPGETTARTDAWHWGVHGLLALCAGGALFLYLRSGRKAARKTAA